MSGLVFVVLTGGPCGGKTTLIRELLVDPTWSGRIAALPEAISLIRWLGVSPAEPLFQRLMVLLQTALEDAVRVGLQEAKPRLVLCHRGSLDPLAYWLARGWKEEDFFAYTGTSRQEHYRRYDVVFHLVTTADGAPEAYRRWPDAHRPETPEEAIRLDRLLQHVWGRHPRYIRLDNAGKDWNTKSALARRILEETWQEFEANHNARK
jgi:predicted ATPase